MRSAFAGYRHVLRIPAFRRFWVGTAASRCGGAFTTVALSWLVLDLAGPAELGFLLLLSGIPLLVTGPVAGRALDRFPARLLLGWDNALRCALVASLPVAQVVGGIGLTHVYAVAVVSAASSSLTEVAEGVLVPHLVADEDLEHANSLLSVNWELAYVVGPPVAGLLVGAAGTGAALVVDAASFAVMSAAGFGLPALPTRADRPARGSAALWRFPVALALTAGTAGFLFLGGVVEVFYPVHAQGAGPVLYGVLLGATGVGGLCGVLVGVPLCRRLPARWRVAAVVAAGAPVFALLAVTPPGAVAVGVAALASFLWGPYHAVERSAFQRAVPDAVRGQVTGARTALCSLGFPLGGAAGGALLAGAPTSTAALVVACSYGVVALVTAGASR
ncbi:MFS transporter [Saccharothrix sp. Mg75]|uniref:MFS transporter n=1 Tax=Saccharothrix sp. Mg75 TaxID=3445357 RepID=UPI003EEEC2D4